MPRPDVDDPLFNETWKYESLQHNHPWKWLKHKENEWNKNKWNHLHPEEWLEAQKQELKNKWVNMASKHPETANFLIERGIRLRNKDQHKDDGTHDSHNLNPIIGHILHDFEKIMIDTGFWLVVDQMTKQNVLDLNFFDYVTFILGNYISRNMYEWPVIRYLELPSSLWWHNILNRALIIEIVRLVFVLFSQEPKIDPVKIIHDLSKLTLSLSTSNIFTL